MRKPIRDRMRKSESALTFTCIHSAGSYASSALLPRPRVPRGRNPGSIMRNTTPFDWILARSATNSKPDSDTTALQVGAFEMRPGTATVPLGRKSLSDRRKRRISEAGVAACPRPESRFTRENRPDSQEPEKRNPFAAFKEGVRGRFAQQTEYARVLEQGGEGRVRFRLGGCDGSGVDRVAEASARPEAGDCTEGREAGVDSADEAADPGASVISRSRGGGGPSCGRGRAVGRVARRTSRRPAWPRGCRRRCRTWPPDPAARPLRDSCT